jgi:hypothetical protein
LTQQFMFNFKVEDVTKFLVTGQGKTVAFTKQPDGTWRADAKENAPYEKNITATLQHLAQLQGGVVTAGTNDIALYGLHAPTIAATIVVSGTAGIIPLTIGKLDPDHPSNFYASNFPHTVPVYSISSTTVEQLRVYLDRPTPTSIPTKPALSPSPLPSATATTAPTQIPTFTPSPVPPTQIPTLTPSRVPLAQAVVTPPSATAPPSPIPTLPPIPEPTTTPPPNVVEMLIQFVANNQMLAAISSGICLVALIVLAALAVWFLRRRRPEQPEIVPPPPSAFLEGLGIPDLKLPLIHENMILGRAPDCALSIPEDAPGADTLSRYHARLEKRDNRWVVIDGGEENKLSTNGTYVNGKRTLECYLTDNDEISFGEVKFRFHAQPSDAYPSTGGQP